VFRGPFSQRPTASGAAGAAEQERLTRMHRRPLIGVPTQTLQSLGGLPADFPPSWVMSQRYILALTSVGAAPIMVPLVDDVEALRSIYAELDGVFLPGGADIDPASYKEERHPLCDRSDLARDRVELILTRWAVADQKPVLGVCRGLQLINLAYGGTLYQDLEAHFTGAIEHNYWPFGGQYPRDFLAHDVRVAEASRLREIVGTDTLTVNSMHHQGIRDLGSSLVATAHAPDGLVEAVETTGDHFMVGVQWHPEALNERDPAMHRLFQAFVDAAGEYRESRVLNGALG
jgi:putative glutamine amidotransferase